MITASYGVNKKMPSKYQKIEDSVEDSPDTQLLKPDDSISEVEQLTAQKPRVFLLNLLPWALHSSFFLFYTLGFFLALPHCPNLASTELCTKTLRVILLYSI